MGRFEKYGFILELRHLQSGLYGLMLFEEDSPMHRQAYNFTEEKEALRMFNTIKAEILGEVPPWDIWQKFLSGFVNKGR